MSDFDVFESWTRDVRSVQNLKTPEKVQVPAKRTVKSNMGRLMREKLDGGVKP